MASINQDKFIELNDLDFLVYECHRTANDLNNECYDRELCVISKDQLLKAHFLKCERYVCAEPIIDEETATHLYDCDCMIQLKKGI